MKNIDTILFDIDGTLLDTEIYTISSKIIEGKKVIIDQLGNIIGIVVEEK